MESKPTHKMAPVETYNPDVEAHDVVRLELPLRNEMLGPVVVGGQSTSDDFCMIGETQAGNPDPKSPAGKDPSGDNWREEW